jgi:hypothetical protein
MGSKSARQREGLVSNRRRIVQPLGLSLVHQRERIALQPYTTALPLMTTLSSASAKKETTKSSEFPIKKRKKRRLRVQQHIIRPYYFGHV